MSKYPFYEKCVCGGDFEATFGATMDSFPSWNPVICTQCKTRTNTNYLGECKEMKWPKPDWMTQEEWDNY